MARKRLGSRDPGSSPASKLGDVIRDVLETSGVSAAVKYPKLHVAWQGTVGAEIAQHTRLWGFRRGVLDIAVDSSALMNDMQFHRKAIIDDLRREIKNPFISSLRFIVRPLHEDDSKA